MKSLVVDVGQSIVGIQDARRGVGILPTMVTNGGELLKD